MYVSGLPIISNKKGNVDIYVKYVHIVVPFAYLPSAYSKFEWAEYAAIQAHTKFDRETNLLNNQVVSLKAR